MDELRRAQDAVYANTMEQSHRGIKQLCGVERCQVHGTKAQRSHIRLALRVFFRMESHCFYAVISWFAAKTKIVREAVRAHIARPQYHLVRTA